MCAALQEALFFDAASSDDESAPFRIAPPPARQFIAFLGRFAPIFRTAASFTAFAGAVRNDLVRLRRSTALTNALLLFSPSPQWFASTFSHRTYCRCKRFVPIAPPPAHQLIARLGRFAPIFRTAASFTAFAGAVRNDLHRRVTQLR